MANQPQVATVGMPLDDAAKPAASHRRLLLSGFLGTTIEWYDFMIYGFLAPVVFNRLFFPQVGTLNATIAVFGVFAVGFAARPLGGLFFSHFGDRIGRKPIMVMTLILAGFSTTAIGLIPTYAQLGVMAALLLTVLRFLQGFALGGESGAGPVLAMESAPNGRRGVFAAFVQSGAAAGTTLGALAAFLVGSMPEDEMLSWGWRVPFIASAVIFAIGFYVRVKVEESPVFRSAIAHNEPERVPIVAVLRRCKKPALLVLMCALAESAVFYFTSIFSLSYGMQTLHLSRQWLLGGVVLGNVIGVVTNPLLGALSDRIGRRTLLGAAYGLSGLYVLLLFFPLLRTANPVLVVTAMTIPGAILQPMSLAVSGAFYAELFDDARLRFSGVSLGRQFGTILGGGVMPMISASLLAMSGGDLRWVIAYFVVICAIAFSATRIAHETAHSELN